MSICTTDTPDGKPDEEITTDCYPDGDAYTITLTHNPTGTVVSLQGPLSAFHLMAVHKMLATAIEEYRERGWH